MTYHFFSTLTLGKNFMDEKPCCCLFSQFTFVCSSNSGGYLSEVPFRCVFRSLPFLSLLCNGLSALLLALTVIAFAFRGFSDASHAACRMKLRFRSFVRFNSSFFMPLLTFSWGKFAFFKTAAHFLISLPSSDFARAVRISVQWALLGLDPEVAGS